MKVRALAAAACGLVAAACGGDDGGQDVTLVTYSSFPEADTTLNESLAAFTDDTGIDVEVLRAGDAGTMVSKAVLTAGNPEGDVMFGIDNTFLSRAVDADVFEPYEARARRRPRRAARPRPRRRRHARRLRRRVHQLRHRLVRRTSSIRRPRSRTSPTPRYRDPLVVQNPATSSPGLAFLLATIAEFGEDGWQRLLDAAARQRCRGRRRLGAGVLRALLRGERRAQAARRELRHEPAGRGRLRRPAASTRRPTAVVDDDVLPPGRVRRRPSRHRRTRTRPASSSTSCCRSAFQAELPLNLFVYPANGDVALPDVFTANATVPTDPATLDPATIAANREAWIDEWTDTVLR